MPFGSITVARAFVTPGATTQDRPARFLVAFSPADIETLFGVVAAACDVSEFLAIAKRYGTAIVGQPLRETGH